MHEVEPPRGPKHEVYERCARNGSKEAHFAGEVRIEQLFISNSIDASEAADFLAAVKVGSKVRMRTWGSGDLVLPVAGRGRRCTN